MEIDEKRLKTLTHFIKIDEKTIAIKSDHIILTASLNILVKMCNITKKEIFNLRNLEQLAIFKNNTEKARDLIKYFLSNHSIQYQGKKWLKQVKDKIHKSFNKIKIKSLGNSKKNILQKEKIKKRNEPRIMELSEADIKSEHKLEDNLHKIENDIAKESANEHACQRNVRFRRKIFKQ